MFFSCQRRLFFDNLFASTQDPPSSDRRFVGKLTSANSTCTLLHLRVPLSLCTLGLFLHSYLLDIFDTVITSSFLTLSAFVYSQKIADCKQFL
ncbi:unnamed protein product [Calicophoron daubneyi]|uniref:Uncharacterized protein n=1 Tax=Calicophoron daubneyi TaxID=300641 RepID=A0AAV2T7S2_CALDB